MSDPLPRRSWSSRRAPRGARPGRAGAARNRHAETALGFIATNRGVVSLATRRNPAARASSSPAHEVTRANDFMGLAAPLRNFFTPFGLIAKGFLPRRLGSAPRIAHPRARTAKVKGIASPN